jgi:alkylation response protein AidB-like acyl-CoA dehydrogenase
MNFAFSEEQQELRNSVRRFLEDKSPISNVRKVMETESGVDEVLWTQAAEQLGLCGIAIPEAYGGLGFGSVEQAIVLEELGRALAPIPYLSSVVLGANAIMLSSDEEAKSKLLPLISSGEGRVAVAMFEKPHDVGVTECETKATADGGNYRLQGTKRYVIDGQVASDLLVFAKGPQGISLFHVEAKSAGVVVSEQPSLDLTRRLAIVELNDAPASLLGSEGSGEEIFERLRDIACVQLANEMMGGAQRVLEMAVDYAKVRIQFGRPIGSFQAIKHKCADMLVEVESGKSAAYYGAWAADNDPEELRVAAPLAKAFCADAFYLAASENIQIHGGIGFTWEHDAHLYFKRAKSSQLMFGDSSYFRSKLATSIGI